MHDDSPFAEVTWLNEHFFLIFDHFEELSFVSFPFQSFSMNSNENARARIWNRIFFAPD